MEKIRVKFISIDPNDILRIYNGEFVDREDFEDIFENAEEVFKCFESEIILGAIIDEHAKKAYLITVSTASKFESPFTTLTIWTAEIE
jgi:hypothetical protein